MPHCGSLTVHPSLPGSNAAAGVPGRVLPWGSQAACGFHVCPFLLGQGKGSSGWELRMTCSLSNLIASQPVIQEPSLAHTFLKGFSKNLKPPFKILIMMGNGPFGDQQFLFFFFYLKLPRGMDFNLELSAWKLRRC